MIDDFFHDGFLDERLCLWVHFFLFLKVSDDGNYTIKVTCVIMFDTVENGLDSLKFKSNSVFDNVVKLVDFSLS